MARNFVALILATSLSPVLLFSHAAPDPGTFSSRLK